MLFKRLLLFFSAPVFEGDESKTLEAQLLSPVLNALFFPLLAGAALGPFLDVELRRQAPVWFLIVFTFVARVLMRNGRTRLGGVSLVAGMWIVCTVTSLVNGGVHASAFSAYMLVIILAGLFLTPWAVAVITGLSLAAGVAFLYAEQNGMIRAPDASAFAVTRWIGHAIVFSAAALLVVVFHRIVHNAVLQARAELAERRKAQVALEAAKEAAETANRTKDAFLMTMTHELRTPLNAVVGYSDLLIEEAQEEDRKGDLLELNKIRSAGLHLSRVIQDILDMSSLDSSKMELSMERVEVRPFLQELERAMTPLLEQSGNRLTLRINDAITTIQTDKGRFRQVIWNLLHNANKFTDRGEIAVTASETRSNGRSFLQIDVSDTGIGIPPDHLPKLFTPFMQVDNSATRKYGGSGLGLSIAHGICRLLEGDLAVSSEVGRGTTFTVRLPLLTG